MFPKVSSFAPPRRTEDSSLIETSTKDDADQSSPHSDGKGVLEAVDDVNDGGGHPGHNMTKRRVEARPRQRNRLVATRSLASRNGVCVGSASSARV